MFLIVEIIMLVAGVWALVTGKLPSLLFGGPQYTLEGRGVRLLGLILMLPIPLIFVGSFVLVLLLGEEASAYAIGLELMTVLGVGIAALVVSRLIRQPRVRTDSHGQVIEDRPDIEAIIGKKAQGSLIYALLGGSGVGAIIFCPLAFIRAGQALNMIDEHQIGERHRNTARAARVLAAVVFLAWAAIGLCVLSAVVGGL